MLIALYLLFQNYLLYTSSHFYVRPSYLHSTARASPLGLFYLTRSLTSLRSLLSACWFVRRSVVPSVCHNYVKLRDVPCFYRGTCFFQQRYWRWAGKMLLLCFPPIIALLLSGQQLQGPARCIHENLYFLAPAQTKRMQPILVSCEAPFRSNLQNNSEGYGPHWTSMTLLDQ